MQRFIADLWTSLPPIRRRDEKIAQLERDISNFNKNRYTILEGTEYSKYALPIEYPPSRDFKPRWGFGSPPIAALDNWFRAHETQYFALLKRMREELSSLRSVPIYFEEKNLPQPAWLGVAINPLDLLALYTMVKITKPRRYVEIGSGISTCFAAKAVRDGGLPTKITSIDPEPRTRIDSVCDEVIRAGLETVSLEIFDELQVGDIVFFDGSHRSFMNSDVTVFFIDVLPRLKPGVLVHLHDIQLPRDYPESFKSWYWNEQYLLAVYLMGRMDRLDPVFPAAFVTGDQAFKKELSADWLDLDGQNGGWRSGGSFWFTHLKQ